MPSPSPEFLLAQAAAASWQAYCPYSHFAVGAALLTTDDRIFTACNVENASFGLTLCAERNAIAAAVAQGARTFKAIALTSSGQEPPRPCGACLQTLIEFGSPDLVIHMAAAGELTHVETTTLKALLPSPFKLKEPHP